MRTVLLLDEVAERTNRLEVLSRKCGRRGVLNVARLVAEHGADMPMPRLRSVLTADRERMKAGKVHEPGGCHFPELPGLFGCRRALVGR
jgi:hypothetical protein